MPLDLQWEIDFNRLAVLIPELQHTAVMDEKMIADLESSVIATIEVKEKIRVERLRAESPNQ